jgi:hypothetical protein
MVALGLFVRGCEAPNKLYTLGFKDVIRRRGSKCGVCDYLYFGMTYSWAKD